MSEEIKIDGIPREDYGTPNSQSHYSKNYNQSFSMSEEEIIDKYIKEVNNLIIAYNYHKENGVETALGEKIDIFEGLLDLYQKEKEKKDKIREILEKYKKREIEYGIYFYKEIQELLEENKSDENNV